MSAAALPPRAFVLIRHGETDANAAQIIAGRTEAQLTAKGRAGAAALAPLPWPEQIRLFSSPQDRALATARLAFPTRPLTLCEGLRERDWGRFEGRPVAEQPARDSTPEGGEPWDDMCARVARALAYCLRHTAPDALPVLVAHSGVIRASRALTGGRSDGPSPANTLPLIFSPTPDGRFFERPLFDLKDLT